MSALVWWAIPIAITALAVAIVSLRTRLSDPRTDPMADRARLREAMERPIPRNPRDDAPRDPAPRDPAPRDPAAR